MGKIVLLIVLDVLLNAKLIQAFNVKEEVKHLEINAKKHVVMVEDSHLNGQII